MTNNLRGDARMSDPDWPGVLCTVGSDYRVAMNGKGNRYALQKRCIGPSAREVAWVGPMYATRSALLKAAAAVVEQGARADFGFPESPRDCMADFRASAKARADAFEATDWRRHDYRWSLWTWRQFGDYGFNGSLGGGKYDWLRLIVTPERKSLMLQFSYLHSDWAVLLEAETPAAMARALSRDPVRVASGAALALENLDDFAEAWREVLFQGHVLAALQAVPDDLADLDLPDMPERPSTLRHPVRSARRVAPAGRAGDGAARSGRAVRRKRP